MQVRSLDPEDPLEKEMAPHSSVLAWRIPWTGEPGGLYSPQGHKESDTTERLTQRPEKTGGEVLIWAPEGTRGGLGEHGALGSSRAWDSQGREMTLKGWFRAGSQ